MASRRWRHADATGVVRSPEADMTAASCRVRRAGVGRGSGGKMAAPREPGWGSERMDPDPDPKPSAEETLRQRALQRRLRGRNALTALSIGAVVLGIYGYTLYRTSQERFLDNLEEEVEAARAQAAKTPAN